MLKAGIYEQLITSALQKKINELPVKEFYIAQTNLDKEEAAKVLAEYLIEIIKLALKEVRQEDNVLKQIELCNNIIQFVDEKVSLNSNKSLVSLEG